MLEGAEQNAGKAAQKSLLQFLKPLPKTKTGKEGQTATTGFTALRKSMLPEQGLPKLQDIQEDNVKKLPHVPPFTDEPIEPTPLPQTDKPTGFPPEPKPRPKPAPKRR